MLGKYKCQSINNQKLLVFVFMGIKTSRKNFYEKGLTKMTQPASFIHFQFKEIITSKKMYF